MDDPRAAARALARQHLARGDGTGWFEALYRSARGDPKVIPWADQRPSPALESWLAEAAPAPGRALVVGCGLGDDAELLASRGFAVTAFDVSAQAVAWCARRHVASPVQYVVADLLALPPIWRHGFDLVVEINTLQALPVVLRRRALPQLAELVAPEGRLLVVARAREPHEPEGELPWPLTRDELEDLASYGLRLRSLDELREPEPEREPEPVRRFRACYAPETADRRAP